MSFDFQREPPPRLMILRKRPHKSNKPAIFLGLIKRAGDLRQIIENLHLIARRRRHWRSIKSDQWHVPGAEEDAAVAGGIDASLDAQLEIRVVVPLRVEMTRAATAAENA